MSDQLKKELSDEVKMCAERCNECGACVKRCAFLQRYGTPREIALGYLEMGDRMPFECSLCGLCTEVCPEGADPAALLLELRRDAVTRGVGDLKEHRPLLAYERRGTSRTFTLHGLPKGCERVFFPGCALAGTRSSRVEELYALLKGQEPTLGIVLDCCSSPSRSLGREEEFSRVFIDLRESLLKEGVKEVLVACPNCYKIFKEYGGGLSVKSIYEELASLPSPKGSLEGDILVTIHDPCVMRSDPKAGDTVRQMLKSNGVRVEEMRSSGRRTLCCGEGGNAGAIAPEFSRAWGERRAEEAGGRHIVTYCAGCANYLAPFSRTSHILDLYLDPEATLTGKFKAARAPLTYLNRLRLKRRLRKELLGARISEREAPIISPPPKPGKRASGIKLLIFIAFITAALILAKAAGVGEYLKEEHLRQAIESYGVLAPLAYIFLYSIAPPLMLPGLPITVVGGVLFGPLWGAIYVTIGANIGANIAFLIARYFARGWVEEKLAGGKLSRLDEQVGSSGWKVVALTRLVPLFPFNLLNYAFGLTKIPWAKYALTSLICMTPGVIAYVTFSSSLLDLVKGKVSPELLIGIALVAAVSLIPFLYKRAKARGDKEEI
ncbi:MAG: hypothetical protein C0608_01760 [Deltaproteobacteria bacterium]|nr:MAG: hypothetical protein C0608_01760 [Deltaproteobacteria bacterium]